MVLASSMVMVIGPTPPGTGVICPATSRQPTKSTSPHRLPDGKLCGDVDYEDCLSVAGQITPVPGGVGPMTITMLLANTIEAAERKAGIR